MVQRLDLGGVMAMEPASVLTGTETSSQSGPSAPPGTTPPVGPGPGTPTLGPGAGTPPASWSGSAPSGGSSVPGQPAPPGPIPHGPGLLGPGTPGQPLKSDGHGSHGTVPILFTVMSGPTAVLSMVNPATGAVVGNPVPLPGIQGAWSLVEGLHGNIYIGGYLGGNLYRYDPMTGVATNLGNPTGNGYIFSLSVDPTTGVVWGGTFGQAGQLFSYDPATGQFHNYGPVEPNEAYVRSVAAYGGRIYMGLGSKEPELVAFDPSTGQKTLYSVPIPSTYSVPRYGGTVGVVQVVAPNRLYAQFLGGDLYDIPSGQLVSTFGEPAGLGVSLESLGPKLFYVQHDTYRGTPNFGEGWIQGYNLASNQESTYTQPTAPFAPYLWGDQAHETWLVKFDTPQYPGVSIVALDARSHYWIYNLQNGAFTFFHLATPGQPETIESLGPGPAGTSDLYGAGYLQGNSFSYNPATKESVEETGPGQSEAELSVNGDEIFATYPGGRVWRYDPSRPWQFGPSPLMQKNPMSLGALGNEQIRPFAMVVDAQGNIVVGSVPTYGHFGGALTTVNSGTGAFSALYPLPGSLAALSPVSLAANSGQVVVGTTVSGGNPNSNPPPATNDPALFLYSPATRQVGTAVTAPFDGQWAVDGLVADPATGLVYGITPDLLFSYNPETGEVVSTQSISQAQIPPPAVKGSYYNWGHTTGLVLGANGYLYAIDAAAGGDLLEIDPTTLAYTVVAQRADRIGTDAAGDVYYAVNANLYELVPQS